MPILGAQTTALKLDAFNLAEATPEGDYRVGDERDVVNILRLARDDPPNAVLIPLDDLLPDRLAIALRLWRATRLDVQPVLPPPTSAQLRRRKLMLRAVDAHLADASYRAIAVGLFGGKRVPDGSAWRQHHLRSFTIRLVQDGRALMRGGYLHLLRPDHRKR